MALATSKRTDRVQRGLLLLAIVLVAVNLRPALASVGPLIDSIRAATGLSNTALGLLTTLPLLAFGLVSPLTPFVTRRLGIGGALAAALVLLGVGAMIRASTASGWLFGGTLLIGIGIALGNVLLPALVKQEFPDHSGPMTSLYSSVMGIGATVAAGISVPLALAMGWEAALQVWAIPAFVALAVWLPRLRGSRAERPVWNAAHSIRALGRSPLAWQIALYLGLQSLTFYVILAWLPDLLQSEGMGAAEAGWMLALSQASGIGGSALIPIWAGRKLDQRRIVGVLAAIEAVALAGLLLAGATAAAVWVAMLGFVLGGTFGLSLLFLVLRAPDAQVATALSGMAQSAGYLLAAAGPILFGFLHDATSGWTIPLAFLLVVLAGKLVFGLGAARPGTIDHARIDA